MSAPLKLDADQLRRLSDFLNEISQATRQRDVRIDGYSATAVLIDDISIEVTWDTEGRQYVIDDRVGS